MRSVCGKISRTALALGSVASASGARLQPMSTTARTRSALFGAPDCWFLTGSVNLGHPDKVAAGTNGEDALFESPFVAGVADGVGGWSLSGVDAGEFSRSIMANVGKACDLSRPLAGDKDAADDSATIARVPGPPFDLTAVANVAADNTTVTGSSTLCMAAPGKGLVVQTYNLGDSGWLHLRLGGGNLFGKDWGEHQKAQWGVIDRSVPQNHYFNCPLQLGTGSPDTADMGAVQDLSVRPGDLILLTTDGLFDNMFNHDICNTMRRMSFEPCLVAVEAASQGALTPSGPAKLASGRVTEAQAACQTTLRALSAALAMESQRLGADTQAKSPFATAAAKNGFLYNGGKLDDAAVVLALVMPPAASSAEPRSPRA
jgi:protein phosphatase PTC7